MLTFDLSKRITKHLVVAIALMVLTIAATTFWMAHRHNEQAAENSKIMIVGGIDAQIEELKTLNHDYAWWDEGLKNILEENIEWLHWNLGTAVTESEAIDNLIIINPTGDIFISWDTENGEQLGVSSVPTDIVNKMVKHFSSLPLLPVVAEHSMIKIEGTLFLLTISRVTPQGGVDTYQPGDLPFILMARDLSSERLKSLGMNYLIDDLRFSETLVDSGEQIIIKGIGSEIIGSIHWTPDQPGQTLLKSVVVPLALSLVILIFIASLVNRRFGKVVDVVETSLIRAQAADQAKANFLANVSHELRTPMNGVVTMAKVLKTTDLNEKQTSMLDLILKSSNEQMELINEVLDFSLLDSGALTFEQKPFSLGEITTSALLLIEAKINAKNISLSSTTGPFEPDMVVGDAVRVRQIFTNLLSNAIKFTDRGEIKFNVSTIQKGNCAQIDILVSDTGIGIEKDQLKNIFDRFWQIDSSKTRLATGNGLGLANLKITIEKLRGKVDVESTPGKGSVFTVSFELPLAKAEEMDIANKIKKDRTA